MTEPIRVLELRSVRGTGGGPEKTILLGAARSDPRRVEVTVCYIRDARDRVFALDRLAATLAVRYVEVMERHSFDPAIWPALRRLVRERRIDIVHSHDYKTDLLALLLGRAEGVTPLSTVHGWSSHSARETLLYYPLDQRLLRRFPRVIAVSRTIAAGLAASGVRAERLVTILNGIDSETFRLAARAPEAAAAARAAMGLPPKAVVIGGVGRLEQVKRFDVLIEAVAQAARRIGSLHLVIAGKGSLDQRLVTLARQRGLGTAFTLAGHRSDPMEPFLAMDVFVQSSDTEGTPNAVLEAMALKTPIVATTVGGTADLIEDRVHGLLVPRRDPAAMAAAIVETVESHAATAARVDAARQRVEREFSFDQRMLAVERIYEELSQLRAIGRSERVAWAPARAKS